MTERPGWPSTPMRVGVVLALVGVLGIAVSARYASGWWLLTYVLDALGLVAGVLVWRGHVPAARLVRLVAGFGLGATVASVVGLTIVWPLNLTLTEIRLDPMSFVWPAAFVIIAVCIQFWIIREIGQQPAQTTIDSSGLRRWAGSRRWPGLQRWNIATPEKVGAAVALTAVVLLWAMLHGNSAAVAIPLAQQQLGPGYRYALTWISSASHDGRTAVSGVVTAWNEHEVRTILLHWEKR